MATHKKKLEEKKLSAHQPKSFSFTLTKESFSVFSSCANFISCEEHSAFSFSHSALQLILLLLLLLHLFYSILATVRILTIGIP